MKTSINSFHQDSFISFPNEIIEIFHLLKSNEIKLMVYLFVTRNRLDKLYNTVTVAAEYTGIHSDTIQKLRVSLEKKGFLYNEGKFIKIKWFDKNTTYQVSKQISDWMIQNPKHCQGRIVDGVRYLYYNNKDKKNIKSDFKNSTQIENLFSGAIVKIEGAENEFTLDTTKFSFFKKLSGVALSQIIYFKYLNSFESNSFTANNKKYYSSFKCSYERGCKALGISRDTFSRGLNELLELGIIVKSKSYKKVNEYCFNFENNIKIAEKQKKEIAEIKNKVIELREYKEKSYQKYNELKAKNTFVKPLEITPTISEKSDSTINRMGEKSDSRNTSLGEKSVNISLKEMNDPFKEIKKTIKEIGVYEDKILKFDKIENTKLENKVDQKIESVFALNKNTKIESDNIPNIQTDKKVIPFENKNTKTITFKGVSDFYSQIDDIKRHTLFNTLEDYYLDQGTRRNIKYVIEYPTGLSEMKVAV